MGAEYNVGDEIDVMFEHHHERGVIMEFDEIWINGSCYRTAQLRGEQDVWVNLTKAQSIRIIGRAS